MVDFSVLSVPYVNNPGMNEGTGGDWCSNPLKCGTSLLEALQLD